MKHLGILLLIILFVSACENTKQTIGISTKPFQDGKKLKRNFANAAQQLKVKWI